MVIWSSLGIVHLRLHPGSVCVRSRKNLLPLEVDLERNFFSSFSVGCHTEKTVTPRDTIQLEARLNGCIRHLTGQWLKEQNVFFSLGTVQGRQAVVLHAVLQGSRILPSSFSTAPRCSVWSPDQQNQHPLEANDQGGAPGVGPETCVCQSLPGD